MLVNLLCSRTLLAVACLLLVFIAVLRTTTAFTHNLSGNNSPSSSRSARNGLASSSESEAQEVDLATNALYVPGSKRVKRSELYPGENWQTKTLKEDGSLDISAGSRLSGNSRYQSDSPSGQIGNRRKSLRRQRFESGERGGPASTDASDPEKMAKDPLPPKPLPTPPAAAGKLSSPSTDVETYDRNETNAFGKNSNRRNTTSNSHTSKQISQTNKSPCSDGSCASSKQKQDSVQSMGLLADEPYRNSSDQSRDLPNSEIMSRSNSKGNGGSDFRSRGSQIPSTPQMYWQEDIQLGCRELRARRFITDGFCTSEDPIKEVVCAGNCLPIRDLPWFAEFVKTMARSKLRDYQCVEDRTKRKKVLLLCRDGTIRTYRIKVVKSCKCKAVKKRRKNKSDSRNNRTKTGRGKKKGRRKKKSGRRRKKKRKNRRRDRDSTRQRGGGRNRKSSKTKDKNDEEALQKNVIT